MPQALGASHAAKVNGVGTPLAYLPANDKKLKGDPEYVA
jgi:hypothetical protein